MATMVDIPVVDMVDILVEAMAVIVMVVMVDIAAGIMADIPVGVTMVGIVVNTAAITAAVTTIIFFGEQLDFCLEQL